MGKERWIYSAQPVKPVSRPLGLPTQPFELAARPADAIEIDPLQRRTQLRLVVRKVAQAVRILAVDDLRLLGMQHQLAGRKAFLQRAP
jgi:hypothetical protein